MTVHVYIALPVTGELSTLLFFIIFILHLPQTWILFARWLPASTMFPGVITDKQNSIETFDLAINLD